MKEKNIEYQQEHSEKDISFSLHEEKDYRKPWRIFRVMSEFVEGFQLLSELEKQVTVLGSARTKDEGRYYEIAEELGGLLAKNDFVTVTGGGPGIMEAANKGAYENGGESIGLNIQLPFEQRINDYVKKAIGFYYFSTRKVMLTAPADAFVLFPGGFGTMDEFFEIIDHIELGKMCEVPIILVGSEYWDPLLNFLRESGCSLGSVREEQVEKWHIVETAEEAFEIVNSHGGYGEVCELSPTHFQSEKSMNWRIFRIMAELVEGFEFVSGFKDDVSFYGTKSLDEDSKYYDSAYELGKLIAENNLSPLSGGAPGLDAAVSKGAKENGASPVGMGMKVHGETRINEYIDRSIIFDFPFTRKMVLTAPSGAFIFFPGGFGTLHQLFEILTLMQTNKMERKPVILYDREFWQPWHTFIKSNLEHRFETISPEDDEIYQIVDDIETVMELVNRGLS